ncbi:hypothetical protein DIPPA_00156 [Diplonema papillatum]|nr:hypothetical protein DIPPA_00156 [Diplonema papillatum]
MVNLPVSTGSMATLLAVAYFVMLCNTMWPVIFPLSKLTAEQMADPLLPYWQQGAALEVRAFITTSPSVPESEAACRASDRDCLLAWKQFQLCRQHPAHPRPLLPPPAGCPLWARMNSLNVQPETPKHRTVQPQVISCKDHPTDELTSTSHTHTRRKNPNLSLLS